MSKALEELYLKDNNLFTKYFKWTLDEYKEFRQEILQKDQRIAELEKENKELKNENNEFCDYNKKLRKEKQTEVKEFADKLNEWAKNIASNSFGAGGSIHYNTFLIKLVELLKERGIE